MKAVKIALCALGMLIGCAPQAAVTPTPPPTPLPPAAPFPTLPPLNYQRDTAPQTVMRLPNSVLALDVAAHPTDGWPVVAAIDVPLISDGAPHAFVRAFDPRARAWGATQSVDIGRASIGRHRFRSAAVAVGGDGTIFAVWGASAPPEHALWSSASRDFGATWSAPELVAPNAFGVLDIAAAPDGQLVVLALGREPLAPLVIVRDPSGTLHPPEPLPVPSAWYGSAGAVLLAGADDDARIVALTTAGKDAPGTVFVASRPLRGGPWQVGSRRVQAGADGLPGGVRGIVGGGATVAFTFHVYGSPDLFALVSRDAGTSWSEAAPLPRPSEGASERPFAAPAYDPAGDRLVVVRTCCADARFDSLPSTHYASWSVAGGPWQTAAGAAVPLVSGAVVAGDTALAQARGSGDAWLAWVEQGGQVMARSVSLERLVAPERGQP